MKRGWVIALVLALVVAAGGVVALVLTGGDDDRVVSGGGEGSPRTSAAEPDTVDDEPDGDATEAPDPALQSFYSQQIDWQPCEQEGDDFDCALVEVPLDYDEPDGETLELKVLRDPADSPDARQGSLLVNPGGPGSGGAELATTAGASLETTVTDRFDIVGWDPRGTGESSPIDCLTDAQLDEQLSFDVDITTAAGRAEADRASREFADGCRALSGDLVDHVGTVSSARDMDVLRAVLGDASMHFLGLSYGSQLGATYAGLFPDRADRVVLDGGIDRTLDDVDDLLSQAQGFDRALEAYVTDCVESGDCPLGDSVAEGLDTIAGLISQARREPLDTGGGEPLTGSLARTGVVVALYNEANWPVLTDAMRAALQGDGAQLLQMAYFYSDRPTGTYNSNLMEAFNAISCVDNPTVRPWSEVLREARRFEQAAPTLGDSFAPGVRGCVGFDPGTDDSDEVDLAAAGSEPILVIGTTGDPATPYDEAVALADQLDAGVLLTREGEGHLAFGAGNECIDSAVAAFLVDGEVPAEGTTC